MTFNIFIPLKQNKYAVTANDFAFWNGDSIPTLENFSLCYWELMNYVNFKVQNTVAYCYRDYAEGSSQGLCVQLYSKVQFSPEFEVCVIVTYRDINPKPLLNCVSICFKKVYGHIIFISYIIFQHLLIYVFVALIQFF